jgi:hypothetical protein
MPAYRAKAPAPRADAERGDAADEEAEGGGRDRAEISARERKRREGDPGEPALVGVREGGDQEGGTRERSPRRTV